jgi:NADH:ubiquinone oxidoreductase subunit 6 (subunit J)
LTLQEWFFTALALVGTVAALRLVTAKNVVHAALYLVVTLAAVAAVYLLLAAEFVAWVQVLIYVGAIVVLLLFGLMLTRAPIGLEALDNQQRGSSAIVAGGILAGLTILLWDAFEGAEIELTVSTTADVGDNLFRSYILPFEVVSFLLLAALVGAIVLARREEG